MKKKIFAALFSMMFAAAALAGCGGKAPAKAKNNAPRTDGLVVKILDVGQGDAILIRTPEQTVLIDVGDIKEQTKVRARLKEEKVGDIDKLILTHPHADHMGGAHPVLAEHKVKMVYDNGQPSTTKFYKDYLRTLKEKKIPSKALRDGDVVDFGGGVKFTVLSPTKEMIKDGGRDKDGKINLNINAIEGRLTYGSFAMLFTADGEAITETGILERHKAEELKSQVIKVPHHGSKTSSISGFLKAVNPKWGVISCGEGNDYHHPHPSVLKRYDKHDIDYYRTDVNGTITITSDGQDYAVKPARGKKNDKKGN